jgi:hypothetical protein
MAPVYPATAPKIGRLQQEVTDPNIPSRKAAGKTFQDKTDVFSKSTHESNIIKISTLLGTT